MLELAHVTFDHRFSMAKMLNDSEVSKWLLSVPFPYTLDDADQFIASCICDRDNPDEKRFAIISEGVHAGGIGIRRKHGHAGEVGYWIGHEYRNRGIASKALEILLGVAFDAMHLQRVYAIVFTGNPASERVLIKNGFEYEGFLKKGRFKNGTGIDCKLFAKVI